MNSFFKFFMVTIFMFATSVSAAETKLKSGDFVDADQVHQGEGGAVLVKDGDQVRLKFVNHFYVTPGPDLYVWLVKNPSPKNAQDVKDSPNFELSKLKTPSGEQVYIIPDTINMDDYGSVVIWCKEFGVLFAHAELK